MSKSKRVARIAACVLAGVMAMQMTGCGNKKVDYSLDGESFSGYSDDNGKSGLSTNVIQHLMLANRVFLRSAARQSR